MANPKHLKILKEGVHAWDRWRKVNPDVTPYLYGAELEAADLRGANLTEADLSRAFLGRADLRGAFLEGADLRGANLLRAQLGGANLHGAHLEAADLHGAHLGGASLRGAYLGGANLQGTDLESSDFTDAFAGFTVFGDGFTVFGANDLSTVEGLDTVRHLGPSSIGIDTIYKSKGNIPEAFLRGCGVPEDFIVYMRSLVGKAIEFYSCFISYPRVPSSAMAMGNRLTLITPFLG